MDSAHHATATSENGVVGKAQIGSFLPDSKGREILRTSPSVIKCKFFGSLDISQTDRLAEKRPPSRDSWGLIHKAAMSIDVGTAHGLSTFLPSSLPPFFSASLYQRHILWFWLRKEWQTDHTYTDQGEMSADVYHMMCLQWAVGQNVLLLWKDDPASSFPLPSSWAKKSPRALPGHSKLWLSSALYCGSDQRGQNWPHPRDRCPE